MTIREPSWVGRIVIEPVLENQVSIGSYTNTNRRGTPHSNHPMGADGPCKNVLISSFNSCVG